MGKISLAFKKLLGNGRAWTLGDGFTAELLEVLVSPLAELKERFEGLKYVHFPTHLPDKNNILNGEELFGLKDVERQNQEERAGTVEAQWSIFSGFQNFKQLENILQKKGLPVVVIEDLDTYYGEIAIGNGNLHVGEEIYDPVVITDNEHVFFVKAVEFLTDAQLESLIETVAKYRQAHLAVYYLPRFLRKKEIHHVLTKAQMQTYFKKQYCNVKKG